MQVDKKRVTFILMVLALLGELLYIKIRPKYHKCKEIAEMSGFTGSLNPSMGDNECWGSLNHIECGFDDGDCLEFNKNYPNCTVDWPSDIGDGRCDGGDYNTEECDWDGGDCLEFNEKYPNCTVGWPFWIGNGRCEGGNINTEECGWDGGDCLEFNKKYPNCHVGWPGAIGNGWCNGGDYNTEECGWDGGDCL